MERRGCKKNKICSSSTDSVPEYRVEEDRYGRLVNKEKRLIWPSKKAISKKIFDEVFPVDNELSATYVSDIQTISDPSDKTPTHSDIDAFIGGVTSAEAETRIGYRSFVIYYKMPDDGSIAFTLSLYLAYRSSNNSHFHFPISQTKHYDVKGNICRTFYKVECGDSLEFLSMETLIRHYETFVYHDIVNGAMESFPVGTFQGSIYDIYK